MQMNIEAGSSINKEKAIKLISIVVGLLITVVLIWFALRYVQRGRAVDLNPADVKTENITATSFSVKYAIRCGLTPVVNYGSSATALNFLVPPSETTDMGNENCQYKHDITLLTEPTYYFTLKIGEEEITNGGVPFMVTLTGGGTITPTGDLIPTVEATASPTVVVASPTASLTGTEGTLKALSDITDCSEMKGTDGMLKNGYTARDWAQCLKQNE